MIHPIVGYGDTVDLFDTAATVLLAARSLDQDQAAIHFPHDRRITET